MLEVPGVGDRSSKKMSRQTLAEVIEPRVEELYSLVQAELRRSGFEELLSSGIVITGGSAAMQGMVELGEEVFHMPVRLGLPVYAAGLAEVIRSPRYSTGVGLLMAGLTQHQRHQIEKMQSGSFKHIVERMRRWFETNF
jgi:cell division protein FtsA